MCQEAPLTRHSFGAETSQLIRNSNQLIRFYVVRVLTGRCFPTDCV